ncbi:glycosyltransferase family 2 protein [Alkalihalophilus pseudofirmus]|uniref:Glycosyltransferase family 2 protein n=1 Tax=Alkalihalophilus pseudofirmus TaxID=79885 RepID=A0AAJ2NNG1_ALKPS|nr:glycosyltransferase family 2 protein [Alkalihalophilus pseudofirmus]MDV2885598.1 glycosyltransferase family 2 protein [Alkalihalophilus pseudofirmus]
MITISLCMIVKNEEKLLKRCLESVVDLVDEINIIDTGSTDTTIKIAKEYTDRVYPYKWNGHFADARNESFKYATKEYILYLDADDVIKEEDRTKFKKLKNELPQDIDSVSMFYHAGLDAYGNVTLKYRRNRLVKRSKQYRWVGDVHNFLEVHGKVYNSTIAITHLKEKHAASRNLNIYKEKLNRGDQFSARDFFYYGNELRENNLYLEAIQAYEKSIEHENGWVEDKFYSCIFKADCLAQIGKTLEQRNALLQSLRFAKTPRPEMCCRLGDVYLKETDYISAKYWYELSLVIPEDSNKWSFTYPAYSTWYPHLQLCICNFKLGKFKAFKVHNEKAAAYVPRHPAIEHNRKLLKNIA